MKRHKELLPERPCRVKLNPSGNLVKRRARRCDAGKARGARFEKEHTDYHRVELDDAIREARRLRIDYGIYMARKKAGLI